MEGAARRPTRSGWLGVLSLLAVLLFLPQATSAQTSPRFECISGKALNGGNDRTLLQQSQTSCERACAEWAECASFDYGFNQGGICYLSRSRAAADTSLVSNPNFLYCAKTNQQSCVPRPERYECWSGLALQGGNDRSYANQTYGQCAQLCSGWGPCQSFDYGEQAGGACYLSKRSVRSGSGVTVRNDKFIYCERVIGTACPNPALPQATEFECRTGAALSGGNDKVLLQQSQESCERACRSWDNCRSFDFGFGDNGICYLSSKSERDGSGRIVVNSRYRYCEKSR